MVGGCVPLCADDELFQYKRCKVVVGLADPKYLPHGCLNKKECLGGYCREEGGECTKKCQQRALTKVEKSAIKKRLDTYHTALNNQINKKRAALRSTALPVLQEQVCHVAHACRVEENNPISTAATLKDDFVYAPPYKGNKKGRRLQN